MLAHEYPLAYYIGIDLGQRQDYTAIAVIEEPVWIADEHHRIRALAPETGWVSPQRMRPDSCVLARKEYRTWTPPEAPPLHLRGIERLPLDTPYPRIVEHVAELVSMPPFNDHRTALILDETGVGVAVADLFADAGLPSERVSIHGGINVNRDRNRWTVPKRVLVSHLQSTLQTGRLRIADGMPFLETLKAEFQNFKAEIDHRTAHDSYSAWREGIHDDLVLAVALAVWYREFTAEYTDRAIANLRREGDQQSSRQTHQASPRKMSPHQEIAQALAEKYRRY